MKVLLVLAAIVALSLASLNEFEVQTRFTQWMQLHKKSYHHDEFQQRYRVFKANLEFIESHNAANKTFTVALNKFADLTAEEFGSMYRGTKYVFNGEFPPTIARPNALPVHWDWNAKGAVTPIKNQQQCGSCWSFSTTGSTEGCHYIKTNKLVSLSEQNLMDCSWSQGNQGCDGGLMTQAMTYIIQNKGIDTESSYPYTAQDGNCQFNVKNVGATLTSFVNVNQGDEGDLQTKTMTGPVSVAIDASHSSFQFYSSGVYVEPDCSSTQLDHGVLSIGWGHDSGSAKDYWIVKNSWGTDWGLNGFIWMARNENNMCGIATMATLPQC